MTIWVSAHSHRARAKLRAIAGDLPSWGVWPDGDWPHGDYYQVPTEHIAAVSQIKGLRVMAREPAGGRLFKHGLFSQAPPKEKEPQTGERT